MPHHEVERVAAAVVSAAAGRSIATAESCTSGRIATALATAEAAVESFRGGVVAYQEATKRVLLGVTAASVFSETAAEEMASGAAALFGADVTVATTGVVGDDPVDGVEPGTVFIATVVEGVCRSTTMPTSGHPSERCDQAARAALHLLRTHLVQSERPTVRR